MCDVEMQRKYTYSIVTILLSAVAALFILEMGVRVTLPRTIWELQDATDDWKIDSKIGWVQKGTIDSSTRSNSGHWVEFKTNKDGLLPYDAKLDKNPGAIRILMFGDSTIIGRAVSEEARVHQQLKRELFARGITAEVFNAGVQGYSTDQELLRLEQLGPSYRPEIVINVVCINDFGQNAVERAYGVSKPRFDMASDGQIRYMPPATQEQIPKFGGGLSLMLQYSALYRTIQPTVVRIRSAIGSWEERNMAGLADEIYYSPSALNNMHLAFFEALIMRMQDSSLRVGARFYLYLHPALEEIWEPYIADSVHRLGISRSAYNPYALEQEIKEIAHRHGIEFIPQIDEFRARASEGPFHLLPRDPHCNETCYRITAEIVATRIVADLRK